MNRFTKLLRRSRSAPIRIPTFARFNDERWPEKAKQLAAAARELGDKSVIKHIVREEFC